MITAPRSSPPLACVSLCLPVLCGPAQIGLSMGAGDVCCQYLGFAAERARLLEAHAAALRACPAAAAPPPMPDVDELLAHRPTAAAPVPRLPALPAFVLESAPRWWNPTRSLAMAATGLLAGGPWNFTLARVGEHLFPGRLPRAIAAKMAVNMATAPIGISSTFFLTNHFQGHHSDAALRRIRDDMPRTFVAGFFFWPFVSYLNIRFLDVAYRPVAGALAGAVWNIYVSAQANSKPAATITLAAAAGLPGEDDAALATGAGL